MREGDRFALVLVTAPLGDAAEALARSLVDSRLAACVNRIEPIRSTYRWRGEVHADDEALLLIKTSRDLLDRVETHVRENHPYEVPEILALAIDGGNAAYLDWIAESLRSE
ncbi:MAG: divalent-cation tolerance protein CutA [Candidatus Eisenbacteria bacterium]|nr:divalent-cation tolerance protein CutA [Candidatus Eisenbacteria bacterium]